MKGFRAGRPTGSDDIQISRAIRSRKTITLSHDPSRPMFDNLPPLLTREEEIKLGKKLKSRSKKIRNTAKNKLVEANVRLVMKIAGQYVRWGGRPHGSGSDGRWYNSVDYEDLVSEGVIGLMKAADKYDVERGVKFSTYSSWWIKQQILRTIAKQSRLIRLPCGVQDTLKKVLKYIEEQKSKTGVRPSDEHIQQKFKVSRAFTVSVLNNNYNPQSLNAPAIRDSYSHEDCTSHSLDLESLIQDSKAASPAEACQSSDEVNCLKKHLNKLTTREAQIISSRFGLKNEEQKTLEEIGKKLGVTRERIRQLEKIALQKLKKFIEQETKNHVTSS